AGGTDQSGDGPVGQCQIDILQRVRLAVVEIQVPHLEFHRVRLGTGTGRGRGGSGAGDRRSCTHRRPPGFNVETMMRAAMLRMRMVSVMSSAPDQASCCMALYGL